jgi:hypothetical protein
MILGIGNCGCSPLRYMTLQTRMPKGSDGHADRDAERFRIDPADPLAGRPRIDPADPDTERIRQIGFRV